MRDISHRRIAKDVASIRGHDGDKVLIFGETGRLTYPKNEPEYLREVKHVALETNGIRTFIREPKAEIIEFEELPEVSQLLVRRFWDFEDVKIPPHPKE